MDGEGVAREEFVVVKEDGCGGGFAVVFLDDAEVKFTHRGEVFGAVVDELFFAWATVVEASAEVAVVDA